MYYKKIIQYLYRKHPTCGVRTDVDKQTIKNIWRGEKKPSLECGTYADGGFWFNEHGTGLKGDGKKFLTEICKFSALKAMAILKGKPTLYPYKEQNGELKYCIARFDNDKGDKDVRPFKPNGEMGIDGIERILYRLPELLDAEEVLIAEGEKCVDKLVEQGFVATTNPFGASSWKPEFNTPFVGKVVVLIPDNDAPGKNHMETIAQNLMGVAKSLKWVELPLEVEKEDVYDWFEKYGGTPDQLRQMIDQKPLYELPVQSAEAKANPSSPKLETTTAHEKYVFKAVSLETIQNTVYQPRQFRIEELLPEVSLTVVVGEPKSGKSRLELQTSIDIAMGRPVFGKIPVNRSKVLYFALENDDQEIQDTLRSMGIWDCTPDVQFCYDLRPIGSGDGDPVSVITKFVKDNQDFKVFVIDVLALVLPDIEKGNMFLKQYQQMNKLKKLVMEQQICLVLVHHTKKGETSSELEKISGSQAIAGCCDCIWILKKNDQTGESTLWVKGRSVKGRTLAMKFEDNGSFSLIGDGEEFDLSKSRREIIGVLKQKDIPMTPTEIASALGKSVGSVKKLCPEMARAGQIIRLGNGKYTTRKPTPNTNTLNNPEVSNPSNPLLEGNNNALSSTEMGYLSQSNPEYPSNPISEADNMPEDIRVTGLLSPMGCSNPKQTLEPSVFPVSELPGYRNSIEVPNVDYVFITGPDQADPYVQALQAAECLSIDCETTGLDPYTSTIRLMQIAAPYMPVLVFDLFELGQLPESVQQALQGPALKVFHNAKFDLNMLKVAGVEVQGPMFDTMLAARLLSGGRRKGCKLSELCQEFLGYDLPKEQQTSDWSQQVLTSEQLEYAARDASILLELMPVLAEQIETDELQYAAELEFNCLPAVCELELAGMRLDIDKAAVMKFELDFAMLAAEETLNSVFNAAGTPISNINSNPQLLTALNALGILVQSTSKDTLEPLKNEHPVIQAILEYRKAGKLLEFLDKFLEKQNPLTGRIHASYWQLGTETGRFSCSTPNLQQVPKQLKTLFIPAPGNAFVRADFSQIELRTAASISQDKAMIEAYQNGQDLHALTASKLTGKALSDISPNERQQAKAVNFGLIFGMQAQGLMEYARNSYGVEMSLEQAETYRRLFFEGYPGFNRWFQQQNRRRKDDFSTRSLSGRIRVWDKTPRVTEYVNSPIQGTAADIMKMALGFLPDALTGTQAKIIACVHDEALIECPAASAERVAAILKETMEAAGSYYLKNVPVVAEPSIQTSWAE